MAANTSGVSRFGTKPASWERENPIAIWICGELAMPLVEGGDGSSGCRVISIPHLGGPLGGYGCDEWKGGDGEHGHAQRTALGGALFGHHHRPILEPEL